MIRELTTGILSFSRIGKNLNENQEMNVTDLVHEIGIELQVAVHDK